MAAIGVAPQLRDQRVPFRPHRRHVDAVHGIEIGGVEARAENRVLLRQPGGLVRGRPGDGVHGVSSRRFPRREADFVQFGQFEHAARLRPKPVQPAGAGHGGAAWHADALAEADMARRAMHQHAVARPDLDVLRNGVGMKTLRGLLDLDGAGTSTVRRPIMAWHSADRASRRRGRQETREHRVVGRAERLQVGVAAGGRILQRQPAVGPGREVERRCPRRHPRRGGCGQSRAARRAGTRSGRRRLRSARRVARAS